MHNERSAARRTMPVHIFRRGEEPGDDLSSAFSVEERLAMVGVLSQRMWRLTGRPFPTYTRATIPCVVIRHE